MTAQKCSSIGCSNEPDVRVVRIHNRAVVSELELCFQHAAEVMPSLDNPQKAFPSDPSKEVLVDIEYILLCPKNEHFGLYLREMDGIRRFASNTGWCEWWTIYKLLKKEPVARPMTHAAVANIICSLGAQLESVVVDNWDQNQNFHAKLRLRQGPKRSAIDVRPSDGFALAIVSSVPIFVQESFLLDAS